MSGLFVGANTVYLRNAAPKITDYPFSAGAWVNLAAVGTVNRNIFSLVDTGTTNNYLHIRMSNAELLGVAAQAGGTSATASVATALTANTWNYVVGRFISSTNRRISVLFSTGAIEHASDNLSRAPTSLDNLQIGHTIGGSQISSGWDGYLAEIWYAAGDVQPNSAANTDASLLRQLAFYGPFSVPHLAGNIVEYLPFRSSVPTGDRYSEPGYYFAEMPRPTWTIGFGAAAVTLAPHPPYVNKYVLPKTPSGLVAV